MGTGYHGGFGNTKGKKSEITYYSESTEYEKVISSGMNFLEETISQTGIIAGSRTSIGTSSEKRKISRFELYCAFYSFLKLNNNCTDNIEFTEFLLKANPFDSPYESSANPQVYISFCNVVKGRITIKNSYNLITLYVETLKIQYVLKFFSNIPQSEWICFFKQYLDYIN